MSGATPSYRGYRLQALYILQRILSETKDNLIFQPEGIEDLDILDANDRLLELVQVKSYASLVLSNLGSEKKEAPFFKRAATQLSNDNDIKAKVVNFGVIGSELAGAWANQTDTEIANRKNVKKKLVEKHQLTEQETDLVLASVELIPVDEKDVFSSVMDQLQQIVVGIDPESAFDLFMQWIYRLSEDRERVTRTQIIAKLNNIGQVLTQRTNFVSEWHTSIKPIAVANVAPDLEQLRSEFYAGVSTRYTHIEANLDFRRDDKLDALNTKFQENRVVIIHGASGQGKTTLAYRYLHDFYPSSWRYQVVRIESATHALSIASALNAQAAALQAPIIVYVDVLPNDQNWSELIGQLAQEPLIRVLVTVREEDFRRANIRTYRFEFGDLALYFNESEARRIYARAKEYDLNVQAHFLTFEASWEAFTEKGQLLEYVYLLTQTKTLTERLSEQLGNISAEFAAAENTDRWDILRWGAIATAYEGRLDYAKLKGMVQKPTLFGTQLRYLEEEYLIRVSDDGHYIEGLHPIRSQILTTLLVEHDPLLWSDTVNEILHALDESDLQSFLLNAFVDRSTGEQDALINTLTTFHPTTWEGGAGILRALLWVGLRNYIEENRELIDDVENFVKGGWCQIILDIDFVEALEETFPLDEIMLAKAPEANRLKIEQYRATQTPKANALLLARTWLASLSTPPSPPNSRTDWIGFAEVAGWAGHFQINQSIIDWVSDDHLSVLVQQYELEIVGDVSAALYDANQERHRDFIEKHQSRIDEKLAIEYQILAIERDELGAADGESRIRIHLIPSPLERRLGLDPSLLDRTRKSNALHSATKERVELIGYLYPGFDRYASKGYGFTLGKSLPLEFDETKKDVKRQYVTRHWLIRVNQNARGLCENPYRPATWSDYASYLLDARQKAVDNLRVLQGGLIRYIGSTKGKDITGKYLNMTNWDEAKSLLQNLPKLPQSAVDRWGFVSDSSRTTSQSPTEALGILGMTADTKSKYVPSAIVMQHYGAYLQAQKDYLGNLTLLFEQGWQVYGWHRP